MISDACSKTGSSTPLRDEWKISTRAFTQGKKSINIHIGYEFFSPEACIQTALQGMEGLQGGSRRQQHGW